MLAVSPSSLLAAVPVASAYILLRTLGTAGTRLGRRSRMSRRMARIEPQ